MATASKSTIPAPGQVLLVLDGAEHPMFILPPEPPVDDQRPLTAAESRQLATVKATLLKNADWFQQFAEAIHAAHTNRLYRGSHSTLGGFLMTQVAFRPVTLEQFLKGGVPSELAAFKPPRARVQEKPGKPANHKK